MLRYLSKLEPLRLEVIAPRHHQVSSVFTNVVSDPSAHRHRLHELQRFRGSVYVGEGFLRPQALDEQGRHYSEMDRNRWHLLISDPQGAIKACVSMRIYEDLPEVERLTLHEVLQRSTGSRLRIYQRAVRRLLDQSKRHGLHFGEVGGWAVSPDVRCGAATVITILAAWSLPRMFGAGNSICVATVGKGKKAEKILSKMGGFQLRDADEPLPSFFDAGYNSEIDILAFDSRQPCPAAIEGLDELSRRLRCCRVFAPRPFARPSMARFHAAAVN